jgi:glycosyltransferase involved in cell wall biosynthesis
VTIALDATYSIGDELSGVGVYSRELLAGLPAAHSKERFLFCYRPHRYFRSWRERFEKNVTRRILTERWGPRSADLFHGLNQRLPQFPMRRAVATFHDLFVLSGDYSTAEFRARFAAQARHAALRADAIIAVSEFTKSQLVTLLGVEARKVWVAPHGVRGLALRPAPREKIILHVGAIQKRKNIARLVQAFQQLDASWRLVLAGSSGYGAEAIFSQIAASPARDRVLVTGYATTEQLCDWYSRASIFAFPSLDEGFGIPVLEAMAAGIPVVAANRSALPEVAGDAALLVDPECADAIAGALSCLIQNEDLRQQLAARGQKRARQFTWDKAVAETWKVYQSVLG